MRVQRQNKDKRKVVRVPERFEGLFANRRMGSRIHK